MHFFTVDKTEFQLSAGKLIEEYEVYGVKQKQPSFVFDELFDGDELCLEYDVSVLPPSKYLIPAKEPLLELSLTPEIKTRGVTNPRPCIMLGIHPYDLNSIKLLDAVFSGELVDTNYQARRKATIIIGVDCLNPWKYSFAASIGTNTPADIFDLWLTDLGDDYLVEVGTNRGDILLKRYFKWKAANEPQVRQRDQLREKSLECYQLSLEASSHEIPHILDINWENPMWDELGQKCFSCGSCTMVCPTCVCFDVRDEIEINQARGERYRQWDSCMFDGFVKVASGENFRPTGMARLKHRLYRKGKYMLERWGELGCVGCGRCINACLVDIASPVYAYNRLAREGKA